MENCKMGSVMSYAKDWCVTGCVLLAVNLLSILSLDAAELVVDRNGASVEGSTAEYTGMTLRGDYTIGAGASITNLSSSDGTLLDIGPEEGDDVTMTVTGGGQFVGSGTAQKSADAIVIGRNGGKGKIVVQDLPNPNPYDSSRNKRGWNYNNYTFGAMQWKLVLAAGASAAADTMDILQIDTNAFFSVWCVSNLNAAVKARILFNGGTYYMHHRATSGLINPVSGTEIIMEGINGNDVNIMRMSGGPSELIRYASHGAGKLRFCGDRNVIFNGTRPSPSDSRPELHLTKQCLFEQRGDFVAKGHLRLKLLEGSPLPYGPAVGNVVFEDEGTTLDLNGRTVTVNGLLGSGSVTNGSETTLATLTISNTTDRLCSELVSKDLTWDCSPSGIWCVKKGAGLILADSMPSVPVLKIEEGGVRTTSAATPDTMKGQTVEFAEGTSLSVDGGMYTAANTVFNKTVPVTIAAGAVYRAQDGDSVLYSPVVATGGAVEKTGEGTLTVFDADEAFAGTVRAHGGTIKLAGVGDTNDFWRLTIMQSSRSINEEKQFINQLADIVLYDVDGMLAYDKKDMKQADLGKQAQYLESGEITVPEGTEMTFKTPDVTLRYLFDDARWSYVTFPNVTAKLDVESSWFPITFRLTAGHTTVTSFMLRKGWGGDETTPQAWRLESSPNGIDWKTVTERLGGPNLSYDEDGVIAVDPKLFSGNNMSIGLAATAVLRADAGATIDLDAVAEGNAPCGGIEFDYALGGGTITRFEPAANGTLSIVNWPADANFGGYELPLIFGSVVGASNLSTWKLVVNGEQKSNCIALIAGKICVLRKGTVLILR